MKRLLPFILLVLLTAMRPAQAEDPMRYDQVSLSAAVSEQVGNDTMHVTLGTYGEDSDAARLAARINHDMEWALSVVKTHNEVKAATGSYQTWPLTAKDGRTTTGWRGQQTLDLESRDSELLGKLSGELQQRLKISNMSFTVSDERRSGVENRLIGRALDAFKVRARIVATSLQARDFRIVSITINTSSQQPPVMYRPRMALASVESDSAVAVENGESEVQVSVTGSIELVMP
jgi:predicted secreted protein